MMWGSLLRASGIVSSIEAEKFVAPNGNRLYE